MRFRADGPSTPRWPKSAASLKGIVFSPDGRFLYVGNFVDGDIDILRLDGAALTKIGSLALSGHPASMRGSTP